MSVHRTDLASGVIVALVGLLVTLQALDYGLGSLRTIGPGLFPFAAGVALAVLGVLLVISALVRVPVAADRPRRIRWMAVACVFGGLVAWAVLTPLFGLAPGTIALILLASLASGRPQPALLAGLVVVLCGAGYLLFVEALGLPLPFLKL
ncbi:tripartite tricarboxylate transporter TctB family protein [Amorphus coralli]|uniref:tripartite tricarboxylate transporter TctB family protein n=1 Tax=Amorphus coralli TaxID=340680 RepID=UPI00035DE9C2|nr:tripartite tricarboxylate transporter TctB family protein [Amorphus coralli]